MVDLSIPISHLFNVGDNVLPLLALVDSLECRPFSIDSLLPNQKLFHADNIQPIHKLDDSDFLFLERVASLKSELEIISFHCASDCENPKKQDGMFILDGSSPLSRDQMHLNAEINFNIIKSIFSEEVMITVENNNFYNTGAYDIATDPAFIFDIVYDNDIKFLFDTAHARVSAHNLNVDYFKYRDSLPLSRTVQIQFCDAFIPESFDSVARDVHDLPTKNTICEVVSLCNTFDVKYITPEYYGDVDKLKRLLIDLRYEF